MLLKTHIEKMSEYGQATICMKINNIEVARHYVDEINGFPLAKTKLNLAAITRCRIDW